MMKLPRASARVGRPSFALGANDHRWTKANVPVFRGPVNPRDIEEIPMPPNPDETTVRLIETLNAVTRDYLEGV